MATKKNSFKPQVVDQNEATEELTGLRRGRGGKTSKYEPFADAFEDLPEGKVIKEDVGEYSNVTGLRNFMERKFGDDVKVRSVSTDKDKSNYRVFITHNDES